MKKIPKIGILRLNEVEHTISERDILVSIRNVKHPFLVNLKGTFQDESNLYLVLQYYSGGDLATQLGKYLRFCEQRAKFYAAEILLALEELHKRNIIYRDLKPENVLLDDSGIFDTTNTYNSRSYWFDRFWVKQTLTILLR
jgi:serine/threonine protein kinase